MLYPHLPVVKIVGVASKGIIKFAPDHVQPEEAVRQQEYDKAVIKNARRFVGQHNEWYGENVQDNECCRHLNEGEGYGRRQEYGESVVSSQEVVNIC